MAEYRCTRCSFVRHFGPLVPHHTAGSRTLVCYGKCSSLRYKQQTLHNIVSEFEMRVFEAAYRKVK